MAQQTGRKQNKKDIRFPGRKRGHKGVKGANKSVRIRHEVTKVAHHWPEVNARTSPLQVRGNSGPHGGGGSSEYDTGSF
jgi:hypothetical protein